VTVAYGPTAAVGTDTGTLRVLAGPVVGGHLVNRRGPWRAWCRSGSTAWSRQALARRQTKGQAGPAILGGRVGHAEVTLYPRPSDHSAIGSTVPTRMAQP
jgi:hypothetical protein